MSALGAQGWGVSVLPKEGQWDEAFFVPPPRAWLFP